MKITKTTPLHAIAERMGDCATLADAAIMRAILIREHVTDTADVPENEWIRMLNEAVNTNTPR